MGAQERKEQQNTVLAGGARDLELRNADAAVHRALGSLEAPGNKLADDQLPHVPMALPANSV